MSKFNWHRARKAATSGGLAAGRAEHQRYTALVAKYAPLLRPMSAADVEHIAKDKARDAAWRAAAWRELKRRRPNPSISPRKAAPKADSIFITSGMRPDGTLIVFEFATHQAAAAAGFPWAGLSRTVERPPTDRTRRQ